MVVSKWTILVLTCAVAFGSYYSFETPSVLHNAMFSHYGFTDKAEFELYFSLIYSLYALPNMVIPLIGGWLSDQFGNKTIMLLFASFVLLGSAIETVACFRRSIGLFLFGRLVFGCGAETLNVCCSIIISKWFKGQELALALAINLSLSKLATVVTDWTSPLMYRKIGIENNACWVTALCLLCYLLTIVLLGLDTDDICVIANASDRVTVPDEECQQLLHHKITGNHSDVQMTLLGANGASCTHGGAKQGSFHDLTASHPEEALQVLRKRSPEHTGPTSESNPLINRTILSDGTGKPIKSTGSDEDLPGTKYDCKISSRSIYGMDPAHSTECTHPPLKTFLGFSLPVWLLFLFTFMMYGTFIPFTNWSNVILLQFYFTRPNPSAAYIANSEIMAARLQSIPNFLTVFLTPVFGVSVDYFGYRTAQLAASAGLLVAAHCIIYFQLWALPMLPLVLMGLAFSIFGSVVWPCVPVVVQPQQQGTAYGIMTSFQNAGQFVMPLILQQIYRRSHNFGPCEGFFIVSSIAGVVVAVLIWVADERLNHAILRLPDTSSFKQDQETHSDPKTHYPEYLLKPSSSGAQNYGSLEDMQRLPSGSSEKIKIPPPVLRGITGESNTSSLSNESNSNSNSNSNNVAGSPVARSFENRAGATADEQVVPLGCAEKSEAPLLGVSKFAMLRSFTMPARPSVSNNLYMLSEHNSRDSLNDTSSGSQRSQHSQQSQQSSQQGRAAGGGWWTRQSGTSNNSQSSSPSDTRPVTIVPIPRVVHYSQDFYDRANQFQFPREDPLALRRQISENQRVHPWLGIAQSAPAYPGKPSHMEEYQKYRQQQVQLHNQLPQAAQREQLVLASPRRSMRSFI